MTTSVLDLGGPQLDRVRELTSIGAGHAANAFATLVGRQFRMRVPTIRMLRAEAAGSTLAATTRDDEERGMSGIFFEVEGGLGGVLALLFPNASRDRILETLTGRPASEVDPEMAASALREVGNILISHVVNAMADTLGARILPSVPVLAMDDAFSALASLVALRMDADAVLRVETEISDPEGRFRGVLVFVPDRAALLPPEQRGPVRIRPPHRD
jgi:chemotaxis protein CheC